MFAIGIPHLSALRLWLAVSTFFSLVYIVIAIALSVRDGMSVFYLHYRPSFSLSCWLIIYYTGTRIYVIGAIINAHCYYQCPFIGSKSMWQIWMDISSGWSGIRIAVDLNTTLFPSSLPLQIWRHSQGVLTKPAGGGGWFLGVSYHIGCQQEGYLRWPFCFFSSMFLLCSEFWMSLKASIPWVKHMLH